MTERQTEPRQFETEIDIAAPREVVWDALSTARGIARWFAPHAEVDPRVGGEVVWRWGDLHTWRQTIEVFDPGTRIRTRYDSMVADGSGGKVPLFIDFSLEGESGTTTLRLVHSGFGAGADFDGEFDGISRGWTIELECLRLYLERHAGRERAFALSTIDVGDDPDAAWQLLTGPDGFGSGAEADRLESGAPFEFTTAAGTTFAGSAAPCAEREFTGVASSHGDAFVRVAIERCGGPWMAWVWCSRWDGESADALQREFDGIVGRLFAPAGSADS
jgi:uncharacterized protein YndB with AHSA1/START domain